MLQARRLRLDACSTSGANKIKRAIMSVDIIKDVLEILQKEGQ